MDSFATAVSIMLQYGVPLDVLVNKFSHSRFEPSGFTANPTIPMAKSIMDYIFRWLAQKFPSCVSHPAAGSTGDLHELGWDSTHELPSPKPPAGNGRGASSTGAQVQAVEKAVFQLQSDAPPCHECGSVMVRNGSCYRCMNCGVTSGCS
jgi:ribonucleoside-diphosphate reductase alpha chain